MTFESFVGRLTCCVCGGEWGSAGAVASGCVWGVCVLEQMGRKGASLGQGRDHVCGVPCVRVCVCACLCVCQRDVGWWPQQNQSRSQKQEVISKLRETKTHSASALTHTHTHTPHYHLGTAIDSSCKVLWATVSMATCSRLRPPNFELA